MAAFFPYHHPVPPHPQSNGPLSQRSTIPRFTRREEDELSTRNIIVIAVLSAAVVKSFLIYMWIRWYRRRKVVEEVEQKEVLEQIALNEGSRNKFSVRNQASRNGAWGKHHPPNRPKRTNEERVMEQIRINERVELRGDGRYAAAFTEIHGRPPPGYGGLPGRPENVAGKHERRGEV